MADANNTPQTPLITPPIPDLIIPLNFPITTKLTENNFLTWKLQIQPIVHDFNLNKYLEEPSPEKKIPDANGQLHDNPIFSHWERQDQLLLGWIRSSLTEIVQSQVSSCATSYDLWNNLKQSYSATSRARITDLRRQIQTTTKGSASCTDYLRRMRRVADELTFIGSSVTDDDLVMYVLNGLGSKFNSFVVSITTSSRHQPYTYPELHASLMSYENLLQGQNLSNGLLPSPNNPTALIGQNRPGQNKSNYNVQTRPNYNNHNRSNHNQNHNQNQPNYNAQNGPNNPPQLKPPYPGFNSNTRYGPPTPQSNSSRQTTVSNIF